MSAATNVAQKVKRLPKGRAFPLATFLDSGSENAVRTALSRLVKEGDLVNLARGVYARPKPNRFFGTSLPGPEDVAKAIARSTGEHLAPHGAEIARRLGISTQAPTQAAFYTSGRTRRLKVGGTHVHFEHAPEQLVRHAGSPAGRALLALHYLGRERVTTELLRDLTKRVPAADLLREKGTPIWLRDRIEELDADARAA
jgi:hypothetical protein